ncbi:protein tyrosine phosphatase family protein [Pseudomonas aeruginosa]|nr:protein tyrosine phosphatase family protein [Pseudomonas aeruginosa]HEI8721458.1 protein tyrosine phosphatase family protein [Serratia marcescens]
MGDSLSLELEDIINYRAVTERLWTGGQPTDQQLRMLRQHGVEVVINVAPYDSRYSIEDEPGLLQSLGVEYHHHPIAFSSPDVSDYLRVEDLLDRSMGRKVFIHCAANYRVSVLVGSYAVNRLGWNTQRRDDLIRGVWSVDEYPVWHELMKKISREN